LCKAGRGRAAPRIKAFPARGILNGLFFSASKDINRAFKARNSGRIICIRPAFLSIGKKQGIAAIKGKRRSLWRGKGVYSMFFLARRLARKAEIPL
jgi:hypothetical protein